MRTVGGVTKPASSDSRRPQNFLLVLEDGAFVTHALPDSGELVIGRSETCDIVVRDESMSRQHAVICIGNDITIADLGSVNGTSVRGLDLEKGHPVPLSVGESFSAGEVTLVLQRRAAPLRSRRIWGHDYFEGRLSEECARAARSGGEFTVCRLSFTEDLAPADVHGVLGEIIREFDVVGQYGPRDYQLLLVDCPAKEALALAHRVEYAFRSQHVETQLGVAHHPKDGRDPDKLTAHAQRASKKREEIHGPVVLLDPVMRNLYELAERVAVGNINVLILGETGVGKQVLAETIHRHSKRKDKPLLELNCSAFSESLLESELFGHEKGAFTGATSSKVGLLESANGGTVFLDEVGDMELPLQAKLLRALESGEILPLGGRKPRKVDVRFVAATNRNLEQDVVTGRFRRDLYFRINGISLELPPLRERRSEVEALARSFIAEYSEQMGRPAAPALAPDALALLTSYSWPGNIRELRNIMERATLLATGPVIECAHLPVEKMQSTFAAAPPPAPMVEGTAPSADRFYESDGEKKQRILAALEAAGGNNTKAAELLGISRRTLGKWLDAHGIPRPRARGRTIPADGQD